MSRLILLFLLSLCLALFAVDPVPASKTIATTASASSSPGSNSSGTAAPATSPSQPAQQKITYSSIHTDGPYIALTFDDGPSPANTPRLLEILAKRHIKATFFLIGQNAQQNPELVKRIVAEGHEIGNHSWSHPNLGIMSDDKVRAELQKTDDAIFQAVGFHPKLMRPPYGSLAIGQRRWVNKEFGYKIILWDVDPLDWKYRNSAHVESEILKQTRNGSIILSHDIHATTVDAMPATLDQLLAKGYKFVTVPELIAMDKPLPPKQPSATTAKKTTTSPQPAASPASAVAGSSSTPAAVH